MTVDETLEWIFDIFFIERVTVDINTDDSYVPQITYVEKYRLPSGIVTTVILIVLMLSVVMILTNRDKIKFFLQDQKTKKAAKK